MIALWLLIAFGVFALTTFLFLLIDQFINREEDYRE